MAAYRRKVSRCNNVSLCPSGFIHKENYSGTHFRSGRPAFCFIVQGITGLRCFASSGNSSYDAMHNNQNGPWFGRRSFPVCLALIHPGYIGVSVFRRENLLADTSDRTGNPQSRSNANLASYAFNNIRRRAMVANKFFEKRGFVKTGIY